MMTRYKLDGNHQEVVDAFLGCGCRVAEVAKSKSDVPGIPDLVVGVPNHREEEYTIIFVEVKADKGKLRPAQERFFEEWADYPIYIVRSTDDVVGIYNKYQYDLI